MQDQQQDSAILMLCEDLLHGMVAGDHAALLADEDAPLARRFALIRERIISEQHLIEDISRPGRLMVEHFSYFLEQVDHTVGFVRGNIKTGRGLLKGIHIGDWGTISLDINDLTVTWRDADVGYMFYPDRILVRPKDSGQDDMTFFFSYSFKYGSGLLKQFEDVKDHEQTLYWHEGLGE